MVMLTQNAVVIPEKDLYLVSTSTERLETVTLDDGLTLSISGGLEWAQREGNHIALLHQGRYTELCLVDEDPIPYAAQLLLWPKVDGTWVPMRTLDLDLIQLLLAITPELTAQQRAVMEYLIQEKAQAAIVPIIS